jgi:NAD-dependent histone deacetylase SIR2
METQPPNHRKHASSNKSHPSRSYALQVRVFLEAAEDIEIDADTIEDILDGFDDVEVRVEDQIEPDQEDVETDGEDNSAFEALHGEPEDEEDSELSAEGIHCQVVYGLLVTSILSIAEAAWTKQEKRQIVHYVKERG